MKYVRTEDGNNLIIDLSTMVIPYQIIGNIIDFNKLGRFEIIKQADTIEELCDEFVCLENKMAFHDLETITSSCNLKHLTIYGAIWTDKGLIYVAKMNEKGELELL